MRRHVEEFLRHEQRDERHHLQVGLERLELLPDLGLLVGSRLVDRKFGRKCRLLERIGFRARLLGRHVDGDHILAALQQRLQHGLAERLLAVDHDTHLDLRSSQWILFCSWVLTFAGTTHRVGSRYSAAAFFRTAVAPASLRPAISSAE